MQSLFDKVITVMLQIEAGTILSKMKCSNQIFRPKNVPVKLNLDPKKVPVSKKSTHLLNWCLTSPLGGGMMASG